MNASPLATAGASLSKTDYASFGVVVPESLKFTPTRRGLAARRVPVKIRAEQQSYSSTNNKLCRIILPNNAIYDTRAGYLTFTVTLSKTGGTYCRLASGVFSIFNRLRILASSTEIEDLRDFNRIYTALWEMLNPPDVTSSIGVTTMGFGTQVDRNAKFPQADYVCPLFSGVLNTELLPFDNITNGVTLELYLEDASQCVETDGTNPSITISNIIFHMERLDLDPQYRSFISNYVASNGLQLGFHTWERYISALTTGSQQNVIIQCRNSSMNGMLNFILNSATISNTTVNDKYLTWIATFPNTAQVSQTSLQINGTQFPDEPIDCISFNRYEAYQMYCRWVQKWKLNGFLAIAPPINSQAFATSRYVQVDDLEPYPEEPDLVNPFSTLNNNQSLIKKMNFTANIDAGYQLDSWVEYFKQIVISKNGSVLVLQ